MSMFDTPGTVPSPVDLDFEKKETGNEVQGADNTQQPTPDQTDQQPDGQQPPEQDTGELLLGKYKTVEDLSKAHEALQKRLGDMRNELGNLRKQNVQTQPQEQSQSLEQEGEWTPEQWQQYGQQFYQDFTMNPGKAVFDLMQDVINQAVGPLYELLQGQQMTTAQDNAVNDELDLLATITDENGQPLFPGGGELLGQIENLLQQQPYLRDMLANQGIQRANGQIDPSHMGVLEVLYKAAQAEAATTLGKQAYSQGLNQGRQQAHVKSGAALPKIGAKNQNTQLTPEETIVGEIFAHKKGGFFI